MQARLRAGGGAAPRQALLLVLAVGSMTFGCDAILGLADPVDGGGYEEASVDASSDASPDAVHAPDGASDDAPSAPQIYATAAAAIVSVAVANGFVAWSTASGSVYVCAAGPQCVTSVALASGRSSPGQVAVDKKFVYWTEPAASGPLYCATGGCGMSPSQVPGTGNPVALALDPAVLVWTSSSGAISACDAPGCKNPRVVASPSVAASAIATAGTQIVWATGSSLSAVEADGGAASVLTSAAQGLVGLAIGTTTAYWTGAAGLASCTIAGCSPGTLDPSVGAGPGAVAIDSTNVYWSGASSILVCRRSACVPATLAATSQPVVTALAVGGSGVYWAEGASLMHASLPP